MKVKTRKGGMEMDWEVNIFSTLLLVGLISLHYNPILGVMKYMLWKVKLVTFINLILLLNIHPNKD